MISFFWLLLNACSESATSRLSGGSEGVAPRLSETILYRDIATRALNESLHSYTPKFPLWSDGAAKKRWVYLPAAVESRDQNSWVFPKGTVFFKEFSFADRPVETRVLEKTGEGVGPGAWRFSTYRWEDDGSDATLVGPEGVRDAATIGSSGETYDIPTLGQCQRCHTHAGEPILGFDATQLDAGRNEHIPHGSLEPGDLTNDSLAKMSLLTAPVTHRQEDLLGAQELAAVGYLHGNCSSCHSPGGAADHLGMDFRYDQNARVKGEVPVYKTAVDVHTVSFAIPGTTFGVDAFRIVSGNATKSALTYRMNDRGSNDQMPPMASKIKDEDAVELMRRWIDDMK